MSLKNKVAIVTGGSSGIGAAIAIKFTQEGAKVTIVGRNREKLKKVSDICEKFGSKPLIVIAEMTNEKDVNCIVPETLGYFGRIDILVNNAGMSLITDILDDKVMENYETVMTANLHSVVRLTHLAAKQLVENKGNIVNISSIISTLASKKSFAYSVSKAALDHFTRNMAMELSPKGVRVNSVNPGPVRTDALDKYRQNTEETNKLWSLLQKTTLLDRVGDSEEIADLVAFIVSDKGRSITGSILVSDNGACLNGPPDISSELF